MELHLPSHPSDAAMRNTRRLIAGALASLLGVGPSIRADDEPTTFEAAVDVIAVDVSVVDGDGRPVRDLRADEFAVKVEGRTRRVLSIDFVDLGTRPAPARRRESRPQPRRLRRHLPPHGAP